MAEAEVAPDCSSRKRKRSRKEKSSKREQDASKSKRQRAQAIPEDANSHSGNAGSKNGDHDSNSSKLEARKLEESRKISSTKSFEKTKASKSIQNGMGIRRGKGGELQIMDGADTDNISDQPVVLNEESTRGKWFVTGPVGGRIMHLDPQFTNDEEYFAVAKKQGLSIYSTSTSMLFKFLPVNSPDQLSSFCFSATKPQNVYIATNSGAILCWDWEVEQLVGHWTLGSPISSIIAMADKEIADDVIFTLRKTKRCLIERHTPCRGKESGKLRSQRLLEVARPLRIVQALAKGDVIIAAYNGGLYVGELFKDGSDASHDAVYTWREVSCMEPLTCFDARYRSGEKLGSSKKKKSVKKEARGSLDIAVGGVRGAIIVLRDFLRKLKVEKKERNNLAMSSDLLSPRILHWHREAVGSLKWSQDGNYLISGGRETVLVLWQLETGRRQELPHLTSAIDNIVVSPSGSSYLLQLADNSAMVLSTSELSPIAYVAGFQSRIISKVRSEAPQIRTTEEFKNRTTINKLFAKFAAAMNPQRSNELLLATASSQSWTEPKDKIVATPHLQSFNIVKDCQIARQALTRNHATSINVGPEATKLEEPSVILLDVTSDGKWLATVEEWVPPLVDLEYLAPGDRSRLNEQARRREVYLKFWSWDNEANNWTLQTRIDHPHRSIEAAESGITFHLAVNPKRAQFATVGEDCIVRVWKAIPRLRDGTMVVRSGTGEELYTWKCQYTIELERPMVDLDDDDGEEHEEPPAITHLARLCYSQDASVLGICHQLPGKPPSLGKYYLADARNGSIVKTGLGWFGDNLHDTAILDRCLITLSDMLIVWDIVTYELVYGLKLEHARLRPGMRLVTALLAVNPNNNTVAVTLSYITSAAADTHNGRKSKTKHRKKNNNNAEQEETNYEDGKDQKPQNDTSSFGTVTDLYIFDPRGSPKPLFRQEFPEVVAALLPSRTSKSYYLIDVNAQIHTINYRPPLPDIAVNSSLQMQGAHGTAADVTVDTSSAGVSLSGSTNGNEMKKILNDEGNIDTSALLRNEEQDIDADNRTASSTRVIDDEHIEIDEKDVDEDPDKSLLTRTEYDKPVVRPEELAAVLNVAPSHALPPVEQLMYGVINLFSRKKREEGDT